MDGALIKGQTWPTSEVKKGVPGNILHRRLACSILTALICLQLKHMLHQQHASSLQSLLQLVHLRSASKVEF